MSHVYSIAETNLEYHRGVLKFSKEKQTSIFLLKKHKLQMKIYKVSPHLVPLCYFEGVPKWWEVSEKEEAL